ncbi:PhzF family phenazine biosynthesis protein [Undibacter mobilis]|uniref:PhzF family phenazine biosynthesis protein n=1 Tax=Undibacter mobilis TaxID=2292256 RepID=A0A371BBZ5_9BRAD|nr:PhzF family phenazine biosynthesis protein [Undibacter mobilis]RDV05047.1 PhzF family phenazine biosynthesis protein [Undibacter mobilis]
MRRRFITLDVFTRRRFAGNPLGMVFDADGLDTQAMQTIAREFNYSETVFVAPPQDAAHKASMRIFTPGSELPFAGHPTVGAAVGLARAAGGGAQSFVIEEKIGAVACDVRMHDAESGFAEFKLPQLPERVGELPDAALLADGLGLDAADIDVRAFPPSRWSAGVPFAIVAIRSLAAVGRAKPNGEAFTKAFGQGGPAKAYIVCEEAAEAGHHLHVRMFAPGIGVAEDPATGSALASFAGLYVAHKRPADGVIRLAIEQGYEMGRPSVLHLTLGVASGALREASIGGDAVVITEGVIEA